MALPAGNDGPVSFPLEDWQAYAATGPAPELLSVPLQPTVADLSWLRKDWSQGVVAVAVEAARSRNRAASKLSPELVERLIADEQGVMVASSSVAASYKASCFARAGAQDVLDLCCGIGADAFEFARAGLAVTVVDRDPVRAWMGSHNAQCGAIADDVSSPAMLERISGSLVHMDPSRRDDRKRRHDYASYQPGPEAIARIIDAAAGACVKLGPGVDFSLLPTPEGSFLELLSEQGRLTQALLWTGSLANARGIEAGHRVATLLPSGERYSAEPGPLIDLEDWQDSSGSERPVLQYVYEADAALERGSLLGAFAREHGLRPIHPAVGVLTGGEVVDSPWLTRFDVLEAMPWRSKAVKKKLRELDAGIVAVKTRAKAVEPDALQKDLRGKGDRELVVFVLKLGTKAMAIICQRSA